MPARLPNNERPVIASITILPAQKLWLETRARLLSLRHGQHISVSTILRTLIDNYASQVQNESNTNEQEQSK